MPNLKAISLSTERGQWGVKAKWMGCLQGRRRRAECVQNAQRNENEFGPTPTRKAGHQNVDNNQGRSRSQS